MKIDEILDLMDQLLDHAKPIPFASHKVIVDGDRLRELINDMRMNKPEEIRLRPHHPRSPDQRGTHCAGSRTACKKIGGTTDHYHGSTGTGSGNADQGTGCL